MTAMRSLRKSPAYFGAIVDAQLTYAMGMHGVCHGGQHAHGNNIRPQLSSFFTLTTNDGDAPSDDWVTGYESWCKSVPMHVDVVHKNFVPKYCAPVVAHPASQEQAAPRTRTSAAAERPAWPTPCRSLACRKAACRHRRSIRRP